MINSCFQLGGGRGRPAWLRQGLFSLEHCQWTVCLLLSLCGCYEIIAKYSNANPVAFTFTTFTWKNSYEFRPIKQVCFPDGNWLKESFVSPFQKIINQIKCLRGRISPIMHVTSPIFLFESPNNHKPLKLSSLTAHMSLSCRLFKKVRMQGIWIQSKGVHRSIE